MDVSLSLEHIKRWGAKGGMSVLDQGVFSSANFILNILLARWLSSEQFGAYAIALTIFTFFCYFYIAFLLDPIGVLGPTNFPDRLKEYFVLHLKSHFVITTATGLLFVVAALIWKSEQRMVRDTLLVVGATLPFLLLPWYLRRAFYVLGQPAMALWGSVVYAISLVFLAAALRQGEALSSPMAVAMTAVSGLLSGLFSFFAFQLEKPHSSLTSLKGILIQNWNLGKWLILSSLLIAFASQVQIWICGSFLGVDAAGVLRALQMIIQPMMLTITALIALATPVLSLEFSKGNFKGFHRRSFLLSTSLLSLAILFELFLWLFSTPIIAFIYDGKFSEYAFLLPVWGMVPVFLAFSAGMQSSLQAAQRPQSLLVASIFWAPASLGLGVLFTLRSGILGATWSVIIGYIIFTLTLSILYWLWVYRPLAPS